MQLTRRLFQISFLILFFILFLFTVYPFEWKIPVDLFLRMDPLLALSSSLASRSFIIRSIPAVIVLLVTFVMGRLFCGWICPLGSPIDASDASLRAKPKNIEKKSLYKLKWLKYCVLIVFITAAIFSFQIAGLFDPIPLLTRTVVTVIYPIFVFIIERLIDLFYSIGFLEDFAYNLHGGLQGTLLPISAVTFRGSILIGIMFIAILIMGLIQKRYWCRTLCPLGALLGIFSKVRFYRRRVNDACTDCGLCHKNCRMGAIGDDFRSTFHAECINCMDCVKVCPVNAVQFGFTKRPKPASIDLSRRRLLGASLTGVFSLAFLKVGFSNTVKKEKVIRPPGALKEDRFIDKCVRCGECIRICSTSGKGLHFAGLESGWEGLGTPILLTPFGYCEYHCHLCGQVCPTGAIHTLTLEQKHEMKMGTAHFDKMRCIPWYYGDTCMVCEEHCPVPEKAIQFRETKVTTIDGRNSQVLLPYVVESRCVGCGICTKVCPVIGDKGIYLTNDNEMRWYES